MTARTSRRLNPYIPAIGVAVAVHVLFALALWTKGVALVVPPMRTIEAVMIDLPPQETSPETPTAETTDTSPPLPEPRVRSETNAPVAAAKPTSPSEAPSPKPVVAPAIIPAPIVAQPSVTGPASGTAQGVVTPKAYGGGGARGALTRALLKRDLCQQQRLAGKPMDKDCPLEDLAKDEKALPLKPRETRATKLCIAEREKDWQRYRDGTGQYPGLRDMFKGRKDCLKDWKD
ncbi:hypothetical protein [Asticcacaulis machinosus]|uniref:Uncharacterized protein n=1 Tax=Asticcacaulis machinosus TaxID=2984211 RepID=A0ABT5HGV3_9CAUL|nr:hypothetical protein [Asticcacaulis machinosus]MDC7675482.1 hypothetical protein [Asticcacaulis machinosus]